MIDLSTDPDYAQAINDLRASSPLDSYDSEEEENRALFAEHANELVMRINLEQRTVCACRNMFMVDADWCITSAVLAEYEEAYRVGGGAAGAWYQRVEAQLRRQKVFA